LNLYELTVKINLRHCSRVIQLYVQLKYRRDNVIKKSETIDTCYCLATAVTRPVLLGFQFVARSSTRY